MKNLVFATHNQHKIKEVQAKLSDRYKLISLSDLDIAEEVPETADSFEGNALLKARYIWSKFGMSCFADDSGLEVDALGGAPGVHSARYATLQKSNKDNIDLLLENLRNYTDTSAQFHTCIALIFEGQVHYFHGIIRGRLIRERKGTNGFGYDPIFIPEGYNRTFAEMTLTEKNTISHRTVAVAQLVDFLNQIY